MSNTTRRLGSALAAITIASSTLIGLGLDTSTAHAAGAVEVATLLNAPVPASCKHPSTTLDGYEKDYPASNGHSTLQVDQAASVAAGRDQHLVTIVPLSCSAKGKAWPDLLLAYSPDEKLIGTVRMRTLPDAQALGTISELHREDNIIAGTLTTSTAHGYMRAIYHLTVSWRDGHLYANHGRAPIYIDGNPLDATSPYDGPRVTSRSQIGELKPAPVGLRAFLASQWTGHTASMRLARFSNRVHGLIPKNHSFALVEWDPGDVEADVAGKVDGTWQWLHVYWDRGDDLPRCRDVTGVIHRAWVALGLACYQDDGQAVTLGAWPIPDGGNG